MFKGLGNLGNIASIMGSMQQLPDKMKELTDRMKSEMVTESSGCGHVTITMNGVGEVQNVDVAAGVDAAMLADAFKEASNAAGSAAKQMYAQAISDMVAEMNINVPGIDGMLNSLTGNG